jgi:hypothetical protein
MTRRLLALTTALFALSATSASAATICVPTGTGCDRTSPDLPGAISLAADTPTVRDTIRLTAGDFTQNAIVGAANPVDIVGVGQGTGGTILRSPDSNFSLDIQSPGSTVSNLRVRVENQAGMFESGIGLSAAGVVANGVTVLGEPGVDNAVGVIVRTGAILRNSLVRVPPTSSANNAISAEGGALIENVSAAGDRMIDARDPGAPVVSRRLRSSTPSPIGIQAIGAGSVNVSDALIRLSGGSIGGRLYAETTVGGSPTIVARHVTVVGTGDAVNAGRGVYERLARAAKRARASRSGAQELLAASFGPDGRDPQAHPQAGPPRAKAREAACDPVGHRPGRRGQRADRSQARDAAGAAHRN